MKKLLALILAVAMIASVAALAGCSNTAQPADDSTAATADQATADQVPVSDKTYIIYSDNAYAPFEYLDEATGQYVGIDMDIMAAVAEDQGIKYEIHNEGFDASMGAVQSGQADGMIAGMTITDERRETFDFSEAYFDDGQVIVVKPDSNISSLEDLQGKTVACKTSTVGGEYGESIKDQYGFTISYYEGSDTMYQAVLSGAADACIEDYSVIGWAIKSENIELSIITESVNIKGYGFAVKKGENAELLAAFDAGLANIKANGKLTEILAKYGL